MILIKKKLMPSSVLVNLIGLKTIYQSLYILFNLIIVKKLQIEEYGIFSYILALITYFSALPLLGFPIYLQKNTARENSINIQYFYVVSIFALCSLGIVAFLLPTLLATQKLTIIIIIIFNWLLAIPVSINDGASRFSFQYKFLFFSSFWMFFCIVETVFFKRQISFSMILGYWLINSAICFLLLFHILIKLWPTINWTNNRIQYLTISIDLFVLYSVSIPDSFSRFYDRFLAHKFFNDMFLGNYAFNLMIVTTIYSLFIRPINSVLFTKLAKSCDSPNECAAIIKKYYYYGLLMYFAMALIYILGEKIILTYLGLSKYEGTLNIFNICFVNAVLYFLTVPFTNLITLNSSTYNKMIYCLVSLVIFNIPLLMVNLFHSQNSFLIGFSLAYLSSCLFAISIKYSYAIACYKAILLDFTKNLFFIKQNQNVNNQSN